MTVPPKKPIKVGVDERRRALLDLNQGSLHDLIHSGAFDPRRHFRHFPWRNFDFRGMNLRGFDFTGAVLDGARFDDALIGPGPDANGQSAGAAIFDNAQYAKVLLDDITDPHGAALTTRIANLNHAEDWDEYRAGWKPSRANALEDNHLRTGSIFQDAPFAPEMVVVPSGSFMMGTTPEDAEALIARYGSKDYRKVVEREQPRREVTIAHRLAVGRFPVTFEEWDFCFDDNGTKHKPETAWGRGRQPVHSVSWNNITKDYLPWLNTRLGLSGPYAYRLLSESEWEYCCRAGTETAFSFGDTITKAQAQFSEGDFGSAEQTVEVGTFPSNAWGLHDMHGNVWEWCQDVFHDSYEDAPDNGTAREDRPREGPVSRVLRGGSWSSLPRVLRSAYRNGFLPDSRSNYFGFRLARTLNP